MRAVSSWWGSIWSVSRVRGMEMQLQELGCAWTGRAGAGVAEPQVWLQLHRTGRTWEAFRKKSRRAASGLDKHRSLAWAPDKYLLRSWLPGLAEAPFYWSKIKNKWYQLKLVQPFWLWLFPNTALPWDALVWMGGQMSGVGIQCI